MAPANRWLMDETFFAQIKFFDKYYLKKLFESLAKYLSTAPVPIKSSWDAYNVHIEFRIGSNNLKLKIDSEISHDDYVYLLNRWSSKFFPRYHCEVEEVKKPTEQDAAEKLAKGDITIDEVPEYLNSEIKTFEVKLGFVEKVYMRDDQFRLIENDKAQIRQSTIPLSKFVKALRDGDLRNQDDLIYEFIQDNSVVVKDLWEARPIDIDYPPIQLINFFSIRSEESKGEPLVKVDANIYRWNRYRIRISGDTLLNDCQKILTAVEKVKSIRKGETNVK